MIEMCGERERGRVGGNCEAETALDISLHQHIAYTDLKGDYDRGEKRREK